KDDVELLFMEVICNSLSFQDFISRYTTINKNTKDNNELMKIQKEAINKVETKQKEIEEKISKRKEAKKELEKVNQVKKDQKTDLTESKQEVEKEITKLKEQKEEYVAKGND